MLNSDTFDNKKKLTGQREPLFPNGVPGAENGVPADLVKGYQPPPDQTAADNGVAPNAAPQVEAKPKPKPKPKPKLARAPVQPQDPAFDQKPASPPTRISIGRVPKPAASATPGGAQTQQADQPSQSVWPAPPQTAPVQQTAQPGQSIWPNPPAPGTVSH
jgi:hypothetical protein